MEQAPDPGGIQLTNLAKDEIDRATNSYYNQVFAIAVGFMSKEGRSEIGQDDVQKAVKKLSNRNYKANIATVCGAITMGLVILVGFFDLSFYEIAAFLENLWLKVVVVRK